MDNLQEQIQDMRQRVTQMLVNASPSQQQLLERMTNALEELQNANQELNSYEQNHSVLTSENNNKLTVDQTLLNSSECKQVEEALRLSEKRFRLAVDNFSDGTFVIYDVQRRFLFVNANGIRLGGIPESEVLGHTDEEIHPPEITDAYLPFLKLAVETRTSQTAECSITLPTVGKITIVVTYVPVLDEQWEIYQILGITHDITQRKQAEEELKKSYEFLQTVLDTNPNLIWVKDRDDRIVLANQALADFFGIAAEDLLGKTNYDLHTNPDDAELCIQQDREVITTLQHKFIPEEAFPSATGEVHWFQTLKKPLFSKDGQVCQVLGVSTDITERKLAQEKLYYSQKRLNLALEAAHMGCWDWNIQTGLVTWSEHLQRLYNLPLDTSEVTYDTFLSIVHPDDRDRVRQADLNCLKTGDKLDVEFRFNSPDGTIYWIESKGQVFYDKVGKPLWMLGIDIDITKRKQAEAEIRESLQEKEILLQEIHHRVKNNLQIISSLLDLQSQQIKELTILEMFRDSHSRVKSMALVHENLYQSKNYAQVNFKDYIQSLTNHLFKVYGIHTDRINLELDLDELTLNIDTAIPCGLMINELISNALKYAFPNQQKGTISITLHGGEGKPYTIIIKDNGIGLPLNWEIQSANTLGLQLVQILAQQIEGTLEVNGYGGAEFKLNLVV